MSSVVQMSAPQHFDPAFSGEVDVHHLCGAAYKGQIKNGKRHGQGSLIYENGISYSGTFKNNNIHGNGSLIFPNGDSFRGQFKNNVLLPEQCGDYDFSDGSRLIGMPDGKMSEFLKKSMGNPVLWPLRFYCPTSRHIPIDQHELMSHIAGEVITEKRRLLAFNEAVERDKDLNSNGFWRFTTPEEKQHYESLAQGWWNYRISELVEEEEEEVEEEEEEVEEEEEEVEEEEEEVEEEESEDEEECGKTDYDTWLDNRNRYMDEGDEDEQTLDEIGTFDPISGTRVKSGKTPPLEVEKEEIREEEDNDDYGLASFAPLEEFVEKEGEEGQKFDFTLLPDTAKQTNTRYDYDYDPDDAGYERAREDWGENAARKEGLERLAKKEERRRAKRRAAGLESDSEEEEQV